MNYLQSTAQRDFDFIKSVAKRMQSPEVVKNIILNSHNPKPLYDSHFWHDLSIAGGYPGILPLFVELNSHFPSEGWNQMIDAYIKNIKKSIEAQGLTSLSLFGGAAGICYYLRQAAKNEAKYDKILKKLDDFLVQRTRTLYIEPLKNLLDKSQPIPPSLYEVIQGLSGIGIYALMNLDNPSFKELVEDIILLLISLTNPVKINEYLVPGWYVHSDFFFLKEEKQRCPNGNFNLGLSHGIPGVLAFLSIALTHRIEMIGQKDAVRTITSWLQRKRNRIGERFFWNTTISFEEEISNCTLDLSKSKDAWCYGTPGVARTIYLAGNALKDESLKKFALDSFSSIFNSTKEEWDLPGPTVCHGIAGLLLITRLMARDSDSHFLNEKALMLRNILLSYYDDTYPFGFRNPEPMDSGGFAWIDLCDLLEGASGVLLTLFSLHSDNCRWHLPFLIDT